MKIGGRSVKKRDQGKQGRESRNTGGHWSNYMLILCAYMHMQLTITYNYTAPIKIWKRQMVEKPQLCILL